MNTFTHNRIVRADRRMKFGFGGVRAKHQLPRNHGRFTNSFFLHFFRRKSMQYYRLDPVHFVSTPNLSLDACLRLTKAEIQLFTDVNMFIWLEGNLRGCVVTLGNRYAKANNPYLESYDTPTKHNYTVALDAINLYGYCLQTLLPYDHFKWLTREEIEGFNVFDISYDSKTEYFGKVSLEYPKN